nr:MAG TPA: hypothetical protein [Caudoviricetes sp.]
MCFLYNNLYPYFKLILYSKPRSYERGVFLCSYYVLSFK